MRFTLPSLLGTALTLSFRSRSSPLGTLLHRRQHTASLRFALPFVVTSYFSSTAVMASELVIRDVVPGVITTFSRPFKRHGVMPIGGRSTAIKLTNGSIWLLASTPLDEETKVKLDSLGQVEHLAIVDLEHTMYIKEYVEAYPTATIVGPEGSMTKTGLKQIIEFKPKQQQQNEMVMPSELKAEYFPGFINKDIAFFHSSTKTLIEGDLLFNLPCHEQYSNSKQSSSSIINWAFDMSPGSTSHKWFVYKVSATDQTSMAKSVSKVNSWDFERIIPCHGDVIEKVGKKAWEDTYQFYIDDIKLGKLPAHDEL